jgi:fatty acid synthase
MKTPCQHAYINVQTKGDLSSLSWIESPLKHYTDHDQKQLCHVHYAALNFRDVMLATGRLPADAIPGDLATQDCILENFFPVTLKKLPIVCQSKVFVREQQTSIF